MHRTNGLVIIPAYNEQNTIASVIQEVKSLHPDLDLVVINDCSTDHTHDVVRALNVPLISLPCNLGYGGALQTGFKHAYNNGYDFVITMDADGQHDPLSIKTLLKEMKNSQEADLIIGSRFSNSNNPYRPTLPRRLGIACLRFLIRLMTNKEVSDPTTGFQLIRKNILELFAMKDFFPTDYPDADIIIFLHHAGFKIIEVPVIMHQSNNNQSMHGGLKSALYFVKMFLSLYILLSNDIKRTRY